MYSKSWSTFVIKSKYQYILTNQGGSLPLRLRIHFEAVRVGSVMEFMRW